MGMLPNTLKKLPLKPTFGARGTPSKSSSEQAHLPAMHGVSIICRRLAIIYLWWIIHNTS